MKKINKNAAGVIAVALLCCVLMAAFEVAFTPNYIAKSIVKLLLFLLLPSVWAIYSRRGGFGEFLKPSRRGFWLALLVGGGVFCVIFGGYFLVERFFDFSEIIGQLESGAGITRKNFIYAAVYVALINSMLEEFFFRGFAFLTLRRNFEAGKYSRAAAYIFSAVIFALYHVPMLIGWFDIWLLILIETSLVAGGLIFNYFTERHGNIFMSWMIHMFANLAINAVGLVLFAVS